jgi:alkylated DNA repair protein alkB family protein 6
MANEDSPRLLQQQQIPGLPPSMFYISNFISEDEEQRILEKVTSSPSHNLHVPSNLTQSPDSRKPLDIPQTSPSTSHPSPAHREQHSSGLIENATLAYNSRRRLDLVFRRL